MTRELQKRLFKKYPKILYIKELAQYPIDQRGIECDDGWFSLINKTCEEIQYLIDRSNDHKLPRWKQIIGFSDSHIINQVRFIQVKEKFEAAALTKFFEDFNVSKEINQLILQETKYKNDLREYNNWLHWKENRNVDRKKLEIDFEFDCKHGSHLIRLMRTGCELLESKGLIVKRPDAKELLAIRNGEWTYEQLKAEFDKLNEKLEFLYKNTKLPKSVNYERINELYHQICKDFDKLD